ncbi:hypothetical protein [Streptomyces sp. NPDC057623]|uniref:hypothetical protein n=1 Tax=Streptomyces sp. NPDC057623 TaxID=3346187 RepID=UPI0036A88CDC
MDVEYEYSEPEPSEPVPARTAAQTEWRFAAPGLILVEWHDSHADWHNRVMADELFASPSYLPKEGVEALACPCGNYKQLTVIGTWGGPLTLQCPCASPFRATSDAPWAVNLLKRLILWHADATSELRQLNDLIIEHHTAHQIYRDRVTDLVENSAATSTAHDLRALIHAPIPDTSLAPLARAVVRREERETRDTRLRRALREVRLTPDGKRPRYAGGPLTGYLIRAMTVLASSGSRDLWYTEEGRRLLETIDRVTTDIQQHDPGPTTHR